MSWTVREKEYEDLGTPLYGKCASKKLGLFFCFFVFMLCMCVFVTFTFVGNLY